MNLRKGMLTEQYVQGLFTAVQESPFALLARLNMRPDPLQRVKLVELARATDAVDMQEIPQFVRVAAIMALWRVLHSDQAQCLVLSPERERAWPFFDWLKDIVTSSDPVLANITHISARTRMQFGHDRSRCIKLAPNHIAGLGGLHASSMTGIVLDAGNTDTQLLQLFEATIGAAKNSLLIRLW